MRLSLLIGGGLELPGFRGYEKVRTRENESERSTEKDDAKGETKTRLEEGLTELSRRNSELEQLVEDGGEPGEQNETRRYLSQLVRQKDP